MTLVESFVGEMGVLLEKALDDAKGNDAETQRLNEAAQEVMRIYAAYRLDALNQRAASLNRLSDVIDGVIRDVKHAISNFLLGGLLDLKKRIDASAGNSQQEIRHLPATEPVAEAPAAAATTAPAPAFPPPPTDAAYATRLAGMYNAMAIRPEWLGRADSLIDRLIAANGRAQYSAVETATRVPWWFIAIVHSLETGVNFGLHLHNGDPLTAQTTHKPANRPPGNPPFEWKASAIDALTMEGHELQLISDWSLPSALFQWERFNGFGYRKRNIPSPYLWSGSDQYAKGKFTSDGNFDPEAVSKQVGAAVLLKRMVDRGLVTIGQQGAPVAATAAATLPKSDLLAIDLRPFPHAAAEINFPGPIQKGSGGPNVSRVQEWCCYHQFSTGVDGGFGDATAKKVAEFQAARGLGASGIVDEATWLQLTLPMRRALAPLAQKPASVYEATLAVARQHIAETPIEIGGPNSGPWVRLYMTSNQGADQLWCAGFVCFMIQQAARDLGIAMPIPRQVGVGALVADAKAAGRFIPEASLPNGVVRTSKLPAGAIFVRRDPNNINNWVHTGLLAKASADTFDTLEGNTTGVTGGNDGNTAVARTRSYPNTDFLLLV